jgi:hypothetical protein
MARTKELTIVCPGSSEWGTNEAAIWFYLEDPGLFRSDSTLVYLLDGEGGRIGLRLLVDPQDLMRVEDILAKANLKDVVYSSRDVEPFGLGLDLDLGLDLGLGSKRKTKRHSVTSVQVKHRNAGKKD